MTHVSIVVPALNEEQHIARCLAPLTAQRAPDCTTEVIVVDNGSTDRTVDIAKEFGVRVLIRPGLRIAALRNAGAGEATGDVLAFVDADCVVSASWLPAALACLARTGAAVVGNFYTNPPDAGWLASTAERIAAEKRSNTGYIPSGNLVVTRSCFDAVRGFNEQLETNEDVDFCARVRKNGDQIVCDPAIEAIHLGVPRSVGQFFRREMWFGATAFRVFWDDLSHVTNLRVILFSSYFALLIASGIAAAVAALVTGEATPFVVPLIALLAIALWLGYRTGTRRPGWPAEVAYNLLYGFARGAALIRSGAATLSAGLFRSKAASIEVKR